MAAIQAEVARLEAAQSIQRAADSALDSLQDKITVMQVKPCTVASARNIHCPAERRSAAAFDQQHTGHQNCTDACCGVSSIAVLNGEPEAGRRCFAWHAKLVQPRHDSRYDNNHTMNGVFSTCINSGTFLVQAIQQVFGHRARYSDVDGGHKHKTWNHHSPLTAGNGPPVADAQSMVMPRSFSASDEADEDGPLMASPSSTPHG